MMEGRKKTVSPHVLKKTINNDIVDSKSQSGTNGTEEDPDNTFGSDKRIIRVEKKIVRQQQNDKVEMSLKFE